MLSDKTLANWLSTAKVFSYQCFVLYISCSQNKVFVNLNTTQHVYVHSRVQKCVLAGLMLDGEIHVIKNSPLYGYKLSNQKGTTLIMATQYLTSHTVRGKYKLKKRKNPIPVVHSTVCTYPSRCATTSHWNAYNYARTTNMVQYVVITLYATGETTYR